MGDYISDNYQKEYDAIKGQLNNKKAEDIYSDYGNTDALAALGLEYVSADKKFYRDGVAVETEEVRRLLANEIVRVKLTNEDSIAKALKDENGNYTAEARRAEKDYNDKAGERAIDEHYNETLKTAKGLGLDVEEFEKYVKYLQEVNDKLKDHKDTAAEVALANMRINRGVENLQKNFKGWSESIKLATDAEFDWQKDGEDYMNAMEGIRDALSDIANVDLHDLDFDFIENNLDLIEEAATGNEKAIDKLIKAIAIDFAKGLEDSKNNVTN